MPTLFEAKAALISAHIGSGPTERFHLLFVAVRACRKLQEKVSSWCESLVGGECNAQVPAQQQVGSGYDPASFLPITLVQSLRHFEHWRVSKD